MIIKWNNLTGWVDGQTGTHKGLENAWRWWQGETTKQGGIRKAAKKNLISATLAL